MPRTNKDRQLMLMAPPVVEILSMDGMGWDAEDFRLDLEGPSRRSSLATDPLASDGSVTR